MNADELAKGLSKNQIYGDDYGLFNRRIQNMLRQQQAEIEALKANLEHAHGIGEAGGFIKGHKAALEKTLTDEEIVSLINKHIDYVSDGDGMKVVGVMDLCRAILRKAQE